MLVLCRRKGEKIRIGNDITVTVTCIKNGKVTLAVDAPPNVTVHRQEVYDAILKAAMDNPPPPDPT